MRIRRPIALILSAALAAGALTGCSWEEFWSGSTAPPAVLLPAPPARPAGPITTTTTTAAPLPPAALPPASRTVLPVSRTAPPARSLRTIPAHGRVTQNSNLVAPSSLTTLPDDIGSYITGDITGIDLSATQITTIGNGAFLFCENLQTVTLPNSVGTIGSGAFWDCSNLTKINLEDTGITEILNDTFTSCERLATVILPSKLTSIGYGAFQSCTGLTHLYFTSV